ncbi:MAG: SCP2 sterol-binding domain-containing protein [Planctomycetota bacterium]|jgi:putative sterol carrier protein
MVTCADIFKEMPNRFNAEAAGDWNTVVQFNVSGDGGGEWILKVADGKCTVDEGKIEDAIATVNTDAETWVGVNTGTVNPMMAFMSKKLAVTGNMAELMKLNNPAIFRRD